MHIRGWKRLLALTMALATLLATPALANAPPMYPTTPPPFMPTLPLASASAPSPAVPTDGQRRDKRRGGHHLLRQGRLYACLRADVCAGRGRGRGVDPPDALLPVAGQKQRLRPLDAGTAVRLMSVNGDWAMIEYNEHIGFVMRSDLRTESEGGAQATAAPEPEPGRRGRARDVLRHRQPGRRLRLPRALHRLPTHAGGQGARPTVVATTTNGRRSITVPPTPSSPARTSTAWRT